MKYKPRAILFDLDGVLVDSLDAWFTAFNQALKKHGQKIISKHEFITKYWGHDLKYNIEKLGMTPDILHLCNHLYYDNVEKVKIYPHTVKTLQQLNNYKKALITNTPRDSTHKMLEIHNLDQYFNAIITSNDVTYGKPDPEIIQIACKTLQVNPKHVLLIGDTDSDIKAGRAVGCKIIGVKTKADIMVNDISEILSYIKI